MKREKLLQAAGLGAALILATWLLWKYAGTPMIEFLSKPEEFRAWVAETGWVSRVAFVGMVVFQIIVAVIPGEPFEIAAGYAFGSIEGTLLCIAASAIGSMLTFLLVRRFGMKLVRLFFSEEQIHSVRFLKSTEKRDFLFLIIYMLPGTPKDLLGYFAGLTDMRIPVWAMICTFGRIPSVITSTIGGNAIGNKDYRLAVITFVLTLIVSGLGLLIYRFICNRRGQPEQKENTN